MQGGGGGGAAQGGQGGRGGVIQVTQTEKASIDRLKAMGFSEHAAVEAFMGCGKNEEMAANYLFDNPEIGGGGMGLGGFAPLQPQQPRAQAQPQANADANASDANKDDNEKEEAPKEDAPKEDVAMDDKSEDKDKDASGGGDDASAAPKTG